MISEMGKTLKGVKIQSHLYRNIEQFIRERNKCCELIGRYMGRGNSRLIAWEGERTLTWNMQDALLSPESFSVLTGAGLISATEEKPMYVHTTSQVEVKTKNTIVLDELACWTTKPTSADKDAYANESAQIFCMKLNDRGEVISEPCIPASVEHTSTTTTIKCHADGKNTAADLNVGDIVLVDYYTLQTGTNATTIEITPDKKS